MSILGLILIAVLVAFGLFAAFVAVAVFWIMMIVFWVSVFLLALLVRDPHLGFFLAFPATGLIFWAFGKFSEGPSPSDRS